MSGPTDESAVTPGGGFESFTTSGLAGQLIGSYRLIKELGHGGQGFVWLAQDEKLLRKVAIKLMTQRAAMAETARLRFLREAEVASKLDHPGICGVHEFGEWNGMPFIAMQLIDGVALDQKIKGSQAARESDSTVFNVNFDSQSIAVDERPDKGSTEGSSSDSSGPDKQGIMDVVRFIESAARALHAAHEAGLIHRDIKPGNIMQAADGRAVILDFGLARDETSDAMTLTRTGDFMGTPAYMSPEQLLAHRIDLDRRSDVYSLGVTLFECLTLQRPFQAPNTKALYEAISQKDAPDPRAINEAISKDLRVVIETAMAKERDRRYPTSLELAEELRRIREFEPIHARPAGTILRLRRWGQRNPVVAALSVALFVFLVAGLAWTTLKNRELDASNAALGSANVTIAAERQTAEDNAASSKSNFESAQRHLDDFRRMADVKLLAEAESELKKLWPLGAALLPRLAA